MIYIILAGLFILPPGCTKDDEKVEVVYEVSNAVSETGIEFRDPEGELLQESPVFNSKEDVWSRSFDFLKGEIVYISAIYSDTASSVNVRILIGGKVYKQAASNNDPGKYVTVSGVAPY